LVQKTQELLDAAAFAEAWNAGNAMTMNEAVHEAEQVLAELVE
jgi:hypothetical protein